ncbi:MAG: toll/interleukin-1 receptor domain-containing protein [Colwellia sp.]|nr:toll/interleukin-1 receptor domain-containing protein [Colwellia sp.]
MARQLADTLERLGWYVWWDIALQGGERFEDTIQAALDDAKCVIVLWSKKSITSKFVLDEAAYARDKGKLVPVLIEDVELTFRYRGLHTIDIQRWLSSDDITELSDLINNIVHQLGDPPVGLPNDIKLTPNISQDVVSSTNELQKKVVDLKQSLQRLPRTQGSLVGRTRIRQSIDNLLSDNCNTVAIIGWGGIGKTALVKNWVSSVCSRPHQPFAWVFEWTFYGQSSLDGIVSTAPLEAALIEFFKLPNLSGQACERGHEAASYISQMSALVIIDGLEVLQTHSASRGDITDLFLRAFIVRLAHGNSGFCLLTSRISVADLSYLSKECFRELRLGKIPKRDGAQILRKCGVKGNREQLQQASEQFDGHPLSLLLLGNFLAKFLDADILRLAELDLVESALFNVGHAGKVLASYNNFLSNAEGAVLRIMGLFNRPVTIDEIAAASKVRGFLFRNTNLFDSSKQDIELALSRLERLSLINTYREAGIKVDCHPLVRSYQDLKLRTEYLSTWKEVHYAVASYLEMNVAHAPRTIAGCLLLYESADRFCKAGFVKHSFLAIVKPRIWRDDYYTTKHMGLVNLEEALLQNYFEEDGDSVNSDFDPKDAALIKSQMAFIVRSNLKLDWAARLYEQNYWERSATTPLDKEDDYDQRAINCANIAQLYQFRGNRESALKWASRGEQLATKGGSFFWRLSLPCLRAYIENLFTDKPDLSTFRRIEHLQAESEPAYKTLHSIRGYLYVDCLVFELQCKFDENFFNIENWQPDVASVSDLKKRIALGLKHAQEKSVPYYQAMYLYQYAIFLSMTASASTKEHYTILQLLSKSELHLNESKQYQDRCKILAARMRVLNNFRSRNSATWDVQADILFKESISKTAAFLNDADLAYFFILIQTERARHAYFDLADQSRLFQSELDRLTDLIDKYGFRRWEKVRRTLLLGSNR